MQGDRQATIDELRRMLGEQQDALVRAMRDTNLPIERRLDAVNAHLKELNGKVAHHAERLAKGGERMDTFRKDIARIDRRLYDRRVSDREEESGENRRVTWFHVGLVGSGVAGTLAVFAFLWKVWPMLAKLGTP